MPKRQTKKNTANYDYLACCFQGGGAMGSYQVGVLQALQEADYFPDWFVGTSIGAINSALAAGNAPNKRIDSMLAFWHAITRPTLWCESLLPQDVYHRRWRHFLSSQTTVFFGQPGFFTPTWENPWTLHSPFLSYYDTAPLKDTLERFIDFKRLNNGAVRLSVGAVNVSTGKIRYFDTEKEYLGPEHIMASGALPPGFPPVEIEGDWYWDGGLSSNTPLDYVLLDHRPKALLCFMVHLFDSYGLKPTNIDEVEQRHKDIIYSSRFSKLIDMHHEIHQLKYLIHQLSSQLPPSKQKNELIQHSLNNGWDKTINLVRFLYANNDTNLSSKDYEFSRASVLEHMNQGYENGREGVTKSPWLKPVPCNVGIALHDMSAPTETKGE